MAATRCTPLLLAWVFCTTFVGCSSSDKPNAPKPTEALNSDKPNANGQVVSEAAFGAADNYSTIWGLGLGDDGYYSFYGRHNGKVGAGSLTGSGSLRWFQSVAYNPKEVRALPATSVVPNGVVLFGKNSTDADDDSEVGDVTLYTSGGGLLDQIVLSSDTSEVWINAAVPVTDTSLIAVGGERIDGVVWPLIVQIAVRAPGKLVRGAHAVLRSLISGAFLDVAALPPAGGETRLFVTNISTSGPFRVHGFRVTNETIAPVTLDWSRDVEPALGTRLTLERVAAAGNEVYVAGYTDDNRKAVAADGGLWYSALMVSYTTTGVPRWQQVVGLTTHGERFYSVILGPGVVYGVGIGAEYIRHSTDEFGYGLVTKFDPATGAPLNNFTVGQDRYAAGFYAAALKGTNVVGGGWTGWETNNGPYRGWLVDLVPSVAVPGAILPSSSSDRARAGASDARSVEDARSRDWR